jgi:hypothetical protein
MKIFLSLDAEEITTPLSLGDCVTISISRQSVMLNLFQHLIKSICYETLKRVQGDKKWITTQSLEGEGQGEGEIEAYPAGHFVK